MRKSTCTIVALIAIQMVSSQSNYSAFKQRQAALIKYGLAHPSENSIVIEAKQSVPLNQKSLNTTITKILSSATADFDLIKAVRGLYYNLSATNERSLLNAVTQLEPFWLKPNQCLYCYC